MQTIFPPTGPQDEHRYLSVKSEERDYGGSCREFCDLVLRRRPIHPEALEMAANHYTALGYYDDGLRLDERLVALRPDDPGVLYNRSCSLALTGNRDQAMDELERAVAKGYDDFHHMSSDRDLAPLRADPRFKEIVARAARQRGGA